jgi:hypothetical protein
LTKESDIAYPPRRSFQVVEIKRQGVSDVDIIRGRVSSSNATYQRSQPVLPAQSSYKPPTFQNFTQSQTPKSNVINQTRHHTSPFNPLPIATQQQPAAPNPWPSFTLPVTKSAFMASAPPINQPVTPQAPFQFKPHVAASVAAVAPTFQAPQPQPATYNFPIIPVTQAAPTPVAPPVVQPKPATTIPIVTKVLAPPSNTYEKSTDIFDSFIDELVQDCAVTSYNYVKVVRPLSNQIFSDLLSTVIEDAFIESVNDVVNLNLYHTQLEELASDLLESTVSAEILSLSRFAIKEELDMMKSARWRAHMLRRRVFRRWHKSYTKLEEARIRKRDLDRKFFKTIQNVSVGPTFKANNHAALVSANSFANVVKRSLKESLTTRLPLRDILLPQLIKLQASQNVRTKIVVFSSTTNAPADTFQSLPHSWLSWKLSQPESRPTSKSLVLAEINETFKLVNVRFYLELMDTNRLPLKECQVCDTLT